MTHDPLCPGQARVSTLSCGWCDLIGITRGDERARMLRGALTLETVVHASDEREYALLSDVMHLIATGGSDAAG